MTSARGRTIAVEEALEDQSSASSPAPKPFVLIIGFGVPGRAVAELLHFSNVEYCVIEKNDATVRRCAKGHEHIMSGDATDANVLRKAGIERATMVIVALPDEEASLHVTRVARALTSTALIVTRCHYISVGFEARAAGASDVVVAEQVVAESMREKIATMIVDAPKAE
jgi:voltage-gated potassium channel Kch